MVMTDAFESWAIVEIMGHKQLAGRVSEQVVAGQTFVRIDVPAVGGLSPFTKLVGPASIYAITPVAEDVAKLYADRLRERPVSAWDFAPSVRAAIEAHVGDDDGEPCACCNRFPCVCDPGF